MWCCVGASRALAAVPHVLDAGTTVATLRIAEHIEKVSWADLSGERMVNSQFLSVPTTLTLRREYVERLAQSAAYRTLLYHDGLKQGLDRQTTIAQALDAEMNTFLVQQLQNRVAQKVENPTEKEIETFYHAAPQQFEEPEAYTIQYIFAYYDNPQDTEAIKQARARAELALKRVKAGEKFETVAHELSFSPSGNLGEPVTYKPGSLNPALEKLVATLTDGELSDLMSVDSGFVIVRRLNHKKATQRSLEEARAAIQGKLKQTAAMQQWEDYYQQKLKKYQPQLNGQLLKESAISPDAAIFRFANQTVTYGQVQRQIEAIRGLPADKFNVQLTSLFKNRLLAYAARQEGLDQTPEFAEQRRRVLRDLFYEHTQKQIIDGITPQIKLDATEIADFYQANKAYFVSERETKLQLLRILTPDAPASDSLLVRKGAAFKTAQKLRQRLVAGESIEALMKEVNGKWDGNWDFAPYGPRGHTIDLAVEKLNVGDISQPVEDKKGFFIIRVASEHPAKPLAFEAVRGKIEAGLRFQKARQRADELQAQRLKQAHFTPLPQVLEQAANAF
jgi:parvulin-like peptidyl-prolyl isomerase